MTTFETHHSSPQQHASPRLVSPCNAAPFPSLRRRCRPITWESRIPAGASPHNRASWGSLASSVPLFTQ
ncbi:hypothetical protein E2C01_043854 [Portunus trituberculatus]|uniref:Uncharacterized protein n=1 Tax=Portunus trituberculatus TaxID=210409 RepID=A0A5B7G0M6_PORTR|nr:hypothetical protein [Portunus trituberculatus]